MTAALGQVWLWWEPFLHGRAGLFLRFLATCLAFAAVALLLRRIADPVTRVRGHIVASIALIALLAGPMLTALVLGYGLVFWWVVEHAPSGRVRTTSIVGLVALQMAAPVFWLSTLGVPPAVRELVAFTTNMTQLRCWGYAWDRRARHAGAPVSLRDYAHYMLFFPAFVSGPLLSYDEFQAGRLGWYWAPGAGAPTEGLRVERHALVRILLGIAAVVPVLCLVDVMATGGYVAAASHGPGLAWAHAAGIYFGVYFGFSAWSEAAIGVGRLCGQQLPENFDAPHFSYGVADYWRRWNIRLGHWMRVYVYLPLGGGRPPGGGAWRVGRNVLAVFLGIALYHHLGGLKLIGPVLAGIPAFWAGWLLWAAFNIPATLLTRHWRRPERIGIGTVAVVAGTFLFNAMCLMTAFFPVDIPLARLVDIYRRLLFLAW